MESHSTHQPKTRRNLVVLAIAMILAAEGLVAYLAAPDPPRPLKTIEVYVTDAPGDLEGLRARFLAIAAGDDDVPLSVDHQIVELSKLQGPGQAIRIASGRLPVDAGDQVTFIIDKADGLRNGAWTPLEVPANRLTVRGALSLDTRFSTVALLFDFDLNQSVIRQSDGVLVFQPHVPALFQLNYDSAPDAPATAVDWGSAASSPGTFKLQAPPQALATASADIVQRMCASQLQCDLAATDADGCLAPGPCDIKTSECDSSSCLPPQIRENRPPVTPANPSPAHGQTQVSLKPILSWTAGDPDGDLIGFDVLIGGQPYCVQIVARTCEVPTLGPGKTYVWWVLASDGKANSTGGPWNFTTAPRNAEQPSNQPPNVPTNPSPPSGAADQPVILSLQWSGGDPDAGPIDYQVLLSNGTTPATLRCDWQTGTNCNIAGLAPDTTYVWTVLARDMQGAQTAGPIWSFSTAAAAPSNLPPNIPSGPSPNSGSTNVSLSPTLAWFADDPDGDPLTYEVTLNGQSRCVGALRWCSLVDLLPNTTYRWKVVATDQPRSGTPSAREGPEWTFTTGDGTTVPPNRSPGTPSNPSPLDAATGVARTGLKLSWSGSDPDGDALTYQVAFGGGSRAWAPLCPWSASTECALPTLEPATTYFWRVDSLDARGALTTGSTWSFMANRPPNQPSNPTPAHMQEDQPRNPQNANTVTLSWQGSDPESQSLQYKVYLGFSDPPTNVRCDWSTTTTCTTHTLAADTWYLWKVDARDAQGDLIEGPTWRFKTAPEPAELPKPISPPHVG